jgi:CubicO group peptidase (beta-lactamase class C family)
LFDMWRGTRDWLSYPANIGVGFFMRGEGDIPGLFSVINSPRTYGGFGAGSTGFTVDPERDITLTFLSTGLMEDSYHFERIGVIATLLLAALIE